MSNSENKVLTLIGDQIKSLSNKFDSNRAADLISPFASPLTQSTQSQKIESEVTGTQPKQKASKLSNEKELMEMRRIEHNLTVKEK